MKVLSLLSAAVALLAVACGLAMLQWPQRVSCGRTCREDIINLKPGDSQKHCEFSGTTLSVVDLQEKGYTVERGFLPKEVVDDLLAVWAGLGMDSDVNPGGNGGDKPGYSSPHLFGVDLMARLPALAEKIEGVKDVVEAGTDIRIAPKGMPYQRDAVFFHTNVSARNSMMFGWHQDIENYFYFQDLYHYLDMYIMLDKPDPMTAGVMLVPWSTLREQSPKLYELTVAAARTKSASLFSDIDGGYTYMSQAISDTPYLLNFSLDSVACTPELRSGDLLLFRGDTIHRTQPHQTWRTSLNVNVHPPLWTLDTAELARGGAWKYYWMWLNPAAYEGIFHGSWSVPLTIRAGYLYRAALFPLRKVLDSVLEGA